MSNNHQSITVWAVFGAGIVAFMGIGLIDPILPEIAAKLQADPGQVSLLFTSYSALMSLSMLITGVLTKKLGTKWTLLLGMAFVTVFSLLSGLSDQIGILIGYRAFWGFGNALFIATALTTIISASTNGTSKAVILYEAAIGLGFSMGPLLGGLLGNLSWRWPFFAVTVLMGLAFVVLVKTMPTPAKVVAASTDGRKHTGFGDLFRALKHWPLVLLGITALLYNFGFFTILGFGPFVMGLDILGIGFVFMGWGVLVALTSVLLAPAMKKKYGTIKSLSATLVFFVALLAVMGLSVNVQAVVIVGVILSGAAIGNANTLLTTAAMNAAPVERSTASAAYNFLRFIGSAIAPALAAFLAAAVAPQAPFLLASGLVAVALVLMVSLRHHIKHVDHAGH
jgi:ACDE family multidrug resistance protein